MKNFPPILVMVYDRLDCLQKCIDSLKACAESNQSTLYISSDAAYRVEDVKKVEEVRKYINTITGFEAVIPIFHDTNKGLLKAYDYAFNLLFSTHDTLIFLEDDIIVAPDFLQFMKDGLEFYENTDEIISISGFSHSVFFDVEPTLKSEIYFTNRWCPWGFGTWKKKMQSVSNVPLNALKEEINDSAFIKKMDLIGIDLYTAFQRKIQKNEMLSLDYLYVYHMLKNNMFTVTPYTTKTFNIGNDGKGTRTKYNSKFSLFDITTLNEIISYQFLKFNSNSINNSYNFLMNNNVTSKVKRVLCVLGLLQLGYVLNDNKKKWSRKIKK